MPCTVSLNSTHITQGGEVFFSVLSISTSCTSVSCLPPVVDCCILVSTSITLVSTSSSRLLYPGIYFQRTTVHVSLK